MACEVSLASLSLTPEQKTKMDAVVAQHEKEGCTEASEAKYMREAKGILTQEQYAKFEAECKESDKDKTQSWIISLSRLNRPFRLKLTAEYKTKDLAVVLGS